jgi:hypothetical protein
VNLLTIKNFIRVIGACDLLNVAYYAYRQMLLGRVPVVGDLESARALGNEMPTLFPPPFLVALLGAAFMLSMIASGVLLLRGARAGGWLAVAQTPLRPITWWSAAPLLSLASPRILPLVVVLEVLKLGAVGFWLWNERTRPATGPVTSHYQTASDPD